MSNHCVKRVNFFTFFIVVLFYSSIRIASSETQVSCSFLTQRTDCGSFACDAEKSICIPCSESSQCYPSRLECQVNTGKCELPGLIGSMSTGTFLALVTAALVCSVAVVAGVGGGGILVPMFILLMNVPMKTSVGLSQSTICGQSSLNMYLLSARKNPDTSWKRPLINYQYLSLLLPLGLIGAHIGGMLGKVCPDFIRLILLFCLLSIVLLRTIKRLKAQYAEDSAVNNSATVIINNDEEPAREENSSPSSPVVPERAPLEQYPRSELGACIGGFLLLLLNEIAMRMSTCGGFFYWFTAVVPIIGLCAIFYLVWNRLNTMSETTPHLLSFSWDMKNSVYYPSIAIFAGAAAAMLGLGGGLVLGFVLYETLGPEEASATSGAATFFISFSSAIPQILSGVLPLDYCIVMFFVGLGSTSLGQFVIMSYIRKKGYRFLIVAALAAILSLSLLILGGYGIYNAAVTSHAGSSLFSFGRLCPFKISPL